jgi:predicted PurR-regulated permease PerM
MPDTSAKERFSQLLFYALVFLMGYLAFLVLQPFLSSLAWAAVFAMMFHSVHLEFAGRYGPNRGALLTTLIAALLIVAPAVMLVSVLAREVPAVIDYVQQVSMSAPDRIERIWEALRQRIPMPLPEDRRCCCGRAFSASWSSWRRAPAPWWPTCSLRSVASS